MRKLILKELEQLEKKENIEILYAVESGSRAWGFASKDSDYDVRFIYRRDKNFYLRLDKQRDVIEHILNEELDINGWDIDKTLKLLYSSNPTLFEWSNSPIVYKTTEKFENIKTIINKYFKAKSGLYHYLSMAEGNYRDYLKGETVKFKKYFYVLRPILACFHILQTNTPPPMEFKILVANYMDGTVCQLTEKLLDMKMNSVEAEYLPKVQELNDYIELNISSLQAQISKLPSDTAADFSELNEAFLRIIDEKI